MIPSRGKHLLGRRYCYLKQIKDAPRSILYFHDFVLLDHILLGADSLRGTSVSASAAIYAEIWVDYILGVAFRDSLRGTLVNASSALDTVVSDYVSHSYNNLYKLIILVLSSCDIAKVRLFFTRCSCWRTFSVIFVRCLNNKRPCAALYMST